MAKGDEVDLQAIRFLVETDSPAVERALFDMVRDRQAKFDVAALASRILVERNPNRDPSFIEEYWGRPAESGSSSSMMSKFRAFPPPGAHVFGFTRLTKFNPLKVYGELMEHSFSSMRIGAALALGDIGDPAALDPLTKGLNDRNWRVRATAADSVRRLRHSVPSGILRAHDVHSSLVECLYDRKRAVRVAAARALATIGDTHSVEQCRARQSWWARRARADLDGVLRGEIPPLRKTWPGDSNV